MMRRTWQDFTLEARQASYKTMSRIFIQNYRLVASFWLLFVDLASNFVAAALMYLFWSHVGKGDMPLAIYLRLLPLLLLMPLGYFLAGLYPAIGIGPADELRRLTIATSIAYLIIGALSFFFRNALMYSRATFGLSLCAAIFLVPIGRYLWRTILIHLGWWGEPIALIGFGEQGSRLYKHLNDHPELGLKPVLIVNGFEQDTHSNADVVHLNMSYFLHYGLPENLQGIRTALLVASEVAPELMNKFFIGKKLAFHQLIIMSENWLWGTVSIMPYDMQGVLGLEIRQNLLDPGHQFTKRLLDLGIMLLSFPLWGPILGLCCLLIYLDSPGPVFYRQYRIGQHGRKIRLWKLRTMVEDADERLAEYLEAQPHLKETWESHQKLKEDIRITRAGRFLRRFSLDELPQFINVLRGEMSLIGPRPFLQDQSEFYGSQLDLIQQVKPGISGLWQVSGRNDLCYEERVMLDEYYVRNWSVWFDIYLCGCTVVAMLTGKGAY